MPPPSGSQTGAFRVVDHRLVDPNGAPVPLVASPNAGGTLRAEYLVMHYTAGRSSASSVGWLTNPTARASAHLVIGRDGGVTQLVPFHRQAWHAGKSQWLHRTGLNRYSIGIELDNPGPLHETPGGGYRTYFGEAVDPADVVLAAHASGGPVRPWRAYPTVQLDRALEIAMLLVARYGLRDVLGHEDIAPGRKLDPGPAFPLASFRALVAGRADDDGAPVYVTTTRVNLRTGPGTEHAAVLDEPLPKGTAVEVLAADGSWRRVDVIGKVHGVADVQGWVHGKYLKERPRAEG